MAADSVTHLDGDARGAVVVCGSHGGTFSAATALAAGVAGIVFNDAAVGKDGAGVAGLRLLDEHGVPAATVDARTSRIGLAAATAAGTLSHVNAAAAALGVAPGMSATDFVAAVAGHATGARRDRTPVPGDAAPRRAAAADDVGADDAAPDPTTESRTRIADGPVPVWAIDSASLARAEDDGAVLVTGSHAQLVGAEPAAALRADARLAIFNDAGGVTAPSRLDALDDRAIAAVAVMAESARIGDALSSYRDGVIGAVNATATAAGARTGMRARDLVAAVADLEDVAA